jgi:hypothetical protein
MPRLYSVLPTIILALIVAGCASSANAQSQEHTGPSDLMEKSSPADAAITKPEAASDLPANCPITTPPNPQFEPPAPYSPTSPFPGEFWFGSENLWTLLPDHGIWAGLPLNPEGYTQKIFWWSEQFSLKAELEPDLIVFGERLDGKAPPLKLSKATNAFASDIGTAMLVGAGFPTSGCWEITGQYKKGKLTFVIWMEQ